MNPGMDGEIRPFGVVENSTAYVRSGSLAHEISIPSATGRMRVTRSTELAFSGSVPATYSCQLVRPSPSGSAPRLESAPRQSMPAVQVVKENSPPSSARIQYRCVVPGGAPGSACS